MIDQIKLDELKRALGAHPSMDQLLQVQHVLDLDLLRDLVELAESHKEEADAREIWIGGYEAGWEECAEDIRPICTPSMAERAWNRLRKP